MLKFHASLFSMLAFACSACAEQPATSQSSKSFEGQVTLAVKYDYLLALPSGYDEDSTKRWPLVVFLHGAGERGAKVEQVMRHGPPKLIAAGKSIPAIVISPQCQPGQIWNPHAVHALTQHIMQSHRVDEARVYLTGLSMGGFGTWETAMEYPHTYSALVPICGGAGVRFVMAEKIKHIPIWIFHGEKDTVVEPSFSTRMNEVLTKLGAQPKLTLYPGVGHDAWTATYDNQTMWDWLFQQKKAAAR